MWIKSLDNMSLIIMVKRIRESFGAGRIRTVVSMATDSSHRVTMGKML